MYSIMLYCLLSILYVDYPVPELAVLSVAGAMLGAAALGGISNFISGIMGSSAQESANQANLQAVRETNEQNKE